MDDGSTDGMAEITKKYSQHLAWRVSQPNQGLYAALNTGFARSTGEILGWLNANDKLIQIVLLLWAASSLHFRMWNGSPAARRYSMMRE